MSPRVIIVLTADENLQHAAMVAAVESRRAVRLASTVQDTLGFLQSSLDDVDLILLDLDSNFCGVMLLNALAFCCGRIPVATAASIERDCTLPPALAQGIVARFSKPVRTKEISELIERVCGCATAFPRDGSGHALVEERP